MAADAPHPSAEAAAHFAQQLSGGVCFFSALHYCFSAFPPAARLPPPRAGHYVPAASYAIFTRNQALQPGEVAIPLKGFGVGNGLTEAQIQYQYYGQMAYNYSIQKLGYPVVPLATYKTMQKALPSCISQIAACQNDSSVCPGAVSYCNSALIEPCAFRVTACWLMTGCDHLLSSRGVLAFVDVLSLTHRALALLSCI